MSDFAKETFEANETIFSLQQECKYKELVSKLIESLQFI